MQVHKKASTQVPLKNCDVNWKKICVKSIGNCRFSSRSLIFKARLTSLKWTSKSSVHSFIHLSRTTRLMCCCHYFDSWFMNCWSITHKVSCAVNNFIFHFFSSSFYGFQVSWMPYWVSFNQNFSISNLVSNSFSCFNQIRMFFGRYHQ